jgi:hypothetical protein
LKKKRNKKTEKGTFERTRKRQPERREKQLKNKREE